MTTPTEVADRIERLVKAADDAQSDWYAEAAATALGQAVGDHAALIVTALRALGEPSEAAVERAAIEYASATVRPWSTLGDFDRDTMRLVARNILRAALKAARAADE